MYDAKQSWDMTETEKVVAIIKEVGAWRLGNFDGCICSGFSLRNVEIDISCGKGMDRGIRVSSGSMDYMDAELLRPIGEEVQRQISDDSDGRGPIEFELTPAQ